MQGILATERGLRPISRLPPSTFLHLHKLILSLIIRLYATDMDQGQNEELSRVDGSSLSKLEDRALAVKPNASYNWIGNEELLLTCPLPQSHTMDAVSRGGRLDNDERTKPGINYP